MRKRLHVPAAARRFDERRNTSRVFLVAPDALPNAQRAIEQLRRTDPKLCAWLDAGAPAIHSEAEHIAWFGEPYKPRKGQRA